MLVKVLIDFLLREHERRRGKNARTLCRNLGRNSAKVSTNVTFDKSSHNEERGTKAAAKLNFGLIWELEGVQKTREPILNWEDDINNFIKRETQKSRISGEMISNTTTFLDSINQEKDKVHTTYR